MRKVYFASSFKFLKNKIAKIKGIQLRRTYKKEEKYQNKLENISIFEEKKFIQVI